MRMPVGSNWKWKWLKTGSWFFEKFVHAWGTLWTFACQRAHHWLYIYIYIYIVSERLSGWAAAPCAQICTKIKDIPCNIVGERLSGWAAAPCAHICKKHKKTYNACMHASLCMTHEYLGSIWQIDLGISSDFNCFSTLHLVPSLQNLFSRETTFLDSQFRNYETWSATIFSNSAKSLRWKRFVLKYDWKLFDVQIVIKLKTTTLISFSISGCFGRLW